MPQDLPLKATVAVHPDNATLAATNSERHKQYFWIDQEFRQLQQQKSMS
ncbi:hypothetical protein SynSYN20_01028 [Synechococcus sp. SYN20]|nr:hypothetical protein SynSYN20_01028 [Synechococcus sp. SYN20]